MDITDRRGLDVRRSLFDAERFSDNAIARADLIVNTPGSSSSALLVSVTRADHLLNDA